MPESSSSMVASTDPPDSTQHPGPTLLELYSMSDVEASNHPYELLIVYDHYTIGLENDPHLNPATGVVMPNLVFTFTCRHDPVNCKTQRRKRESTGSWGTKNLKSSVERCNKRRGVPNNLDTPIMEFSQVHFRALLTMCTLPSNGVLGLDPDLQQTLNKHSGVFS
ncbi:hypothetical protein FRC06_002374, partial [Ceratobasidium sp. 370]